jgi:uncharacterized protein (DUF433 family)
MKYADRVTVDPEILVGKPVITGTRMSVEFILELLANGWTYEEILNNYPQLVQEDILAAIEYSLEVLKEEKVYNFG